MPSMATMGSHIVIDATRRCLPLVVLTVMDPSLMYVNVICIRAPVVCIQVCVVCIQVCVVCIQVCVVCMYCKSVMCMQVCVVCSRVAIFSISI